MRDEHDDENDDDDYDMYPIGHSVSTELEDI